jgi:hypothetical protein
MTPTESCRQHQQRIEEQKNGQRSRLVARTIALKELSQLGIDPNSVAGQEFLFRVSVFGIMSVQPPRRDLPGKI